MKMKVFLRLGLLIGMLASFACAASQGNVFPLGGAYQSADTMFARLTRIMEKNRALARLNVIGFSGSENLPIYCLDIGRPHAKQNVLLIGQHHGNEVLGVEVVLDWAEQLVTRNRSDKKINAILDHLRFWIVPTVNPEGHRVTSQGLSPNQRKNTRDTNENGRLDLPEDGVDLNRNYPVFWDQFPLYAPSHQNYKGSEPASEREILAITLLAHKHKFDHAIFYHSSPAGTLNEKVFLPALDAENPRQKELYEQLKDFAGQYAAAVPKDFERGSYELSPKPGTRMGTARNYFFHIHGTQAFLVEIGGINPDGVSVVHPGKRHRDRVVTKHLKALRQVFYANINQPEQRF